MVSDAKKKRAAAKKAKVAEITGQPTPDNGSVNGDAAEHTNGYANGSANDLAADVNGLNISDRACTGILTSHPQARDIHLESFSLLFHGHELLQDCNLELNYGRWIPPSTLLINVQINLYPGAVHCHWDCLIWQLLPDLRAGCADGMAS